MSIAHFNLIVYADPRQSTVVVVIPLSNGPGSNRLNCCLLFSFALSVSMSYFLELDFVIKISSKESRRFDLSKVVFK